MTPELQRYYEDRLSMCSSKPWKDLMEDVQQMLNTTNTLDGVTEDNFRYRQGECSIMRWLLSLSDVSEQAYQQLKEEDGKTSA